MRQSVDKVGLVDRTAVTMAELLEHHLSSELGAASV